MPHNIKLIIKILNLCGLIKKNVMDIQGVFSGGIYASLRCQHFVMVMAITFFVNFGYLNLYIIHFGVDPSHVENPQI